MAYGFGESGGARITDASGNATSGTTDARRTDAGRFGRALSLDGRSAAVVRGLPRRALRRAVTAEAWVRPSGGAGDAAIVLGEGPGRPAFGLVAIDGRPAATVATAGGVHLARGSARLRPGRWTHLAAVYGGRSVRLVVDGVVVARAPAAGGLGPVARIRIGNRRSGAAGFRGRIDEVRVYGRPLARRAIARDMRTAVVGRRGPVTRSPLRVPAGPAPAAPPPVTRTDPGGLQFGYVANADIEHALDSARSGHGRLARVEFAIGTPPDQMRPYVEAAAARGIEVLLLAGFHARMPSAAEARNLGAWAAVYGPGGSFWAGRPDARLASRYIEFGNESSYTYQGTGGRGGEYALRFADAYAAVQAANPRVGLLAQADDGGTGSPAWVDAMFDAVPQLASMVAAWTVHPYGPRWSERIDRLVAQTSARGAPATIPIAVTEWGLATDDGRTLSDNYGWKRDMTYAEAAAAVTDTVRGMLAKPTLGPRLRLFTYYQGHDQQPSGTSGEREHYFGILRADGSDKGALTAALRQLADAYPAN